NIFKMLDQKDNNLHQAEENAATGRTEGEEKEIAVDNTAAPDTESGAEEHTTEEVEDNDAGQAAPAAIEVNEGEVLNEIDESNAEDAEDGDNAQRHSIPILDYHAMSLDKLAEELEKLIKRE